MLKGISECHLVLPLLIIAILMCKSSKLFFFFFLTITENSTNRLINYPLHIQRSWYTKLPLESQITQKNGFYISSVYSKGTDIWLDILTLQRNLSSKIWGWKWLPRHWFSVSLLPQHLLSSREGTSLLFFQTHHHKTSSGSRNVLRSHLQLVRLGKWSFKGCVEAAGHWP